MKWKNIAVFCMAGILVFGGLSGCGEQEKDTIEQEDVQEAGDKEEEVLEPAAKEEQHSKQQKPQEKEPEEQEPEKTEFTITAKTYEKGNVHIEYPHVENLVSQEITDWYNNQFKNTVDIHTGEAEEGDLAAASDTVNETFQVTYQSEDMISILIEGNFYAEGAAHPYSYKSSYNINLKTGETMGIVDEYTPEEIVNDILSGQNCTMLKNAETMEPLDGEELESAKQEIEARDREYMLESIKECDYSFLVGADGTITNSRDIIYAYSFRLKDGRWAICTDVSHALGDYLIISYDK